MTFNSTAVLTAALTILSDQQPARATTLATLIDIYEREVTPQKPKTVQAHDKRTLPLFLQAFGAKRRPATLNRRDWDNYIKRRRAGQLAPKGWEGRTVRTCVIEQDPGLLNAVLNWATRAGAGAGGYLLERNPLSGLPVPREESPPASGTAGTRSAVTLQTHSETCPSGTY
jgi:hypothetical protein